MATVAVAVPRGRTAQAQAGFRVCCGSCKMVSDRSHTFVSQTAWRREASKALLAEGWTYQPKARGWNCPRCSGGDTHAR